MVDRPDREQIETALRRAADIGGQVASAAVSVGLLVLVVLIGLAIAAYIFEPLVLEAAADSPTQFVSDQPRVFDAAWGSGTCVDEVEGNATATNSQFLSQTAIAVSGNVSLSNASHALEEPTITKQSGSRYVLAVNSSPANDTTRDCPAVARYSAEIRLPYGVTDYVLVVRHDGNRTLREFSS